MKLKKIVVMTTIAGALGFGAVGFGGGIATAEPAAPAPLKPGHDDPCGPWCNNGPGRGGDDLNRGNGDLNRGNGDWNRGNGDWNRGNGDWNVGGRDWWRGRQGKWWRDDDLPPWGFWGPPPPARWWGAPPWVDRHSINYWGYDAYPEFDDGFGQWGIRLFGLWIPIVGIG